MGNLYAESGLNPHNLQNSYEKKLNYSDEEYTKAVDNNTYVNFIKDAAGYGLAQWTYWSRKQNLLNYARNTKRSIGDITMQLEFFLNELKEGYRGSCYNPLLSAKSVLEASNIILLKYEKPKNQSEAVQQQRASYGQKYYDMFMSSTPTEEEEKKEETPVTITTVQPQNYDKYLFSNGIHYISNSGGDERKNTTGGKAGDQNGHEWELKAWYHRPWSVVLRWPDQNVALTIAELGCAAALNDKIGYDQSQRNTYWIELQKAKFNPAAITVACEEDCSAGVSSNVKAAGYLYNIESLKNLPICSSRNMRQQFVKAGFKALTDSKYIASSKYLLPGDILLYDNHHAATNITCASAVRKNWKPNGKTSKIDLDTIVPEPRTLKKGMSGNDVKELQEALIKLGYDLGSSGADGKFGDKTFAAVKKFQANNNLVVDGIAGKKTLTKLKLI